MLRPILLVVIFLTVQLITAAEVDVEQTFLSAGLVDVSSIAPDIKVKLVNSSRKWNVFKQDFYGGLEKAYLLEAVAVKLAEAQKILSSKYKGYRLLIMDAARPNSVSKVMYQEVKGTEFEVFVANPSTGSMHNYGAAVDITIIDSEGKMLDMGFNPFYSTKTGVILSYVWSKIRKLTDEQKSNRGLLKRIMVQAGFHPLKHEWWHFNGFTKAYTRKNFKMIM